MVRLCCNGPSGRREPVCLGTSSVDHERSAYDTAPDDNHGLRAGIFRRETRSFDRYSSRSRGPSDHHPASTAAFHSCYTRCRLDRAEDPEQDETLSPDRSRLDCARRG